MAASPARAQSSGITTYCNPLDIEYRYSFEQKNERISQRTGADPVIVMQRGAYYLFETLAGGYWRSTDLIHWSFVTPSRWPLEDMVAPAALTVGDTVFLMQSSFDQRPILYTTRPETGRLDFYNRWLPPIPGGAGGPPGIETKGPWDPALFHDPDTKRWFLYWGSSNVFPLYGIELDPRQRLNYEGRPVPLVSLHPDVHGWERFGRDHGDSTVTPYIEGAWMTEHAGHYYLQYAAPGTEYNVYANGTYVGDTPLGPFTYAPNNPIAYRPGGFAAGAGHGNTFEDAYGNIWNTGTTWIGLNWNFERRLVMHPAEFDRDGLLHASTRFGDFPHRTPHGRFAHPDDLFTGWMLLSYHKPATASSTDSSFAPAHVTDEDPRTIWVAHTNRAGEWLQIDLGRPFTLRAVQVDFADHESGIYVNDSTVRTRFTMRASVDGVHWTRIADLSRETHDRPDAYIELPHPVRARYVRYDHIYVGAQHLAISDVRVFGNGDGGAPAAPREIRAERLRDRRDAEVTWSAVPGVVGYNVRWGIAPDKLYESYQRWSDQGTSLQLRALDSDRAYYVAVESFDENGVSALTPTLRLP